MNGKERNVEFDGKVTILVETNPRPIDYKIRVWSIEGVISTGQIDRALSKVYGDTLPVEYQSAVDAINLLP